MRQLALLCILTLSCFQPVLAQAFEKQKAVLFLEHEQASPWTELLRQGLEKGGKDFNYDVRTIVVEPGPAQELAFRKAASEADLILVATDNFHEILRNNAANFRRVKFGCLDAGVRAPNIMSINFADEQAAFLAGLAAEMLVSSETLAPGDAVGWLAGRDSPAMRSLANGFGEGAKLARPEAKVAQALANTFTDGSLAQDKAAWLLSSGAAVIALAAGAANPASLPLLEAQGAWHIALDGWLPGKKALGLISKRTDKAVYEIMESAASPKFAGKEIKLYDLANGGVDFEFSQDFLKSALKSKNDISRRVREIRQEIAKGSIRVRSLRERALCDCLD